MALCLIGYAFLLRLWAAAHLELLPEEAYYWNYSRHLDLSYLDHPPMVAWLIRAGTALIGGNEFGVRLGAVCCGAVTGLYVFRLARNVFGSSTALAALTLSQVLPFYFASGMIITPDAPLTAAWAAALYYLERALIAGHARAWLGLGLSLGLGLLSKYTIVLLGVAAVIFMLWDPASRRWLRRFEPYGALLLAAAVFAPVLVWNAEHQWASFVFQTSRRLAELPRFSLQKLLGAVLLLLTPMGFGGLSLALVRGWPGAPVRTQRAAEPLARPWRLLQVALLLPLSVFVAFSLRHEVKLDWTGAPCVAVLPMLAVWLAAATRGQSPSWRLYRRAWAATSVLLLAVYSLGFYHLAVGIPGLPYSKHTELLPVGWREFGRQIDAILRNMDEPSGTVLVVGMDRYALASERAFYSEDQARAVAGTSSWHLFGGMGLMYERWFPAAQEVGRSLVIVAMDPAQLAPAVLDEHVAELGPLEEGVLERDGVPVRRYYYRVGRGYR